MIYIIIPTYNDNENLERALYSLMSQKHRDFKVKVVDDCGGDSAESVCAKFASLMDIEYLKTTKNSGPGVARQVGLDSIKDANLDNIYCLFMDSDDSFYPNTLDRLFSAVVANRVDIVYGNIVSTQTDEPFVIPEEQQWTWLHGKLYSVEFLRKYNIHFSTLRSNEDLAFNMWARSFATTYHLDEPVYLWQKNENSITHKASSRKLACDSVDYIEAIYYAFKRVKTIDEYLYNSVFQCYNYYEKGKIYHLLTDRIDDMLRTMLRHPDIQKQLVKLGERPPRMFLQYLNYNDTLTFFNETFYQWVLRFISLDELKKAVVKYQEE